MTVSLLPSPALAHDWIHSTPRAHPGLVSKRILTIGGESGHELAPTSTPADREARPSIPIAGAIQSIEQPPPKAGTGGRKDRHEAQFWRRSQTARPGTSSRSRAIGPNPQAPLCRRDRPSERRRRAPPAPAVFSRGPTRTSRSKEIVSTYEDRHA